MPQSKIDTKNPSPAADEIEPAPTSNPHEGEPTSPTLAVSLHPLGLGSLAPRRDAPPAGRGPKPSRERNRGGSKAYGTGRRFNSRHRG